MGSLWALFVYLSAPSADILGHHITAEGSVPLSEKVTAVRDLQEFLGMVNFYHCFIPTAAHIMLSLYSAP